MKRKRLILLFIGIVIGIAGFIAYIISIEASSFWGMLACIAIAFSGCMMIAGAISGLIKDKALKHESAYCIHCGKFSSQGSQFCQHCGASLIKTCPHCGLTINSKVNYCPHCGKPTV